MCVTIPSRCRKHRTSLGLVYMKTGPCHVIWFYCCSYTGVSNQHNVSPSLFDISRQFDVPYNPHLVTHTPHVTRLVYIYTGPCHAICSYCCSYTGISNKHNVSQSLFDISRQSDVLYNPLLVPYTPHVTRISLYKLQILSYHMILPSFIYRYKNST
jgi:pyruvate formate-lyase activating enzyme-like uncharacterized protein